MARKRPPRARTTPVRWDPKVRTPCVTAPRCRPRSLRASLRARSSLRSHSLLITGSSPQMSCTRSARRCSIHSRSTTAATATCTEIDSATSFTCGSTRACPKAGRARRPQRQPAATVASTASGSAGSGGGAAAGGGGDEIEIALGAAVGGEETEIALRVWGVHEVSDEIAVELHRLLKTRVNELGHQVLARLLARNPHARARCPPISTSSRPRATAWLARGETHRHAAYALPASVRDPFVLLLQLRQNICQSTFIAVTRTIAASVKARVPIRSRPPCSARPAAAAIGSCAPTVLRRLFAPGGVVR